MTTTPISKFKIIKKTHGIPGDVKPQTNNPSNHPVIAYINAIKMDPLTANDSIEQLETYKHTEADGTVIQKINVILAELKQFVAEISITKSECQKTKIIDEFKKKYSKLSDNDFVKRIDLTAPKKDRKPDINTTIWKTSKDGVYSNPSYLSSTPAQVSAFKSAFRKKKMSIPDDLREKIKDSIDGNYTKLAIHKYDPERLNPKIYNPEKFAGLFII
jgi:hypothetical protein